jgi:integrase
LNNQKKGLPPVNDRQTIAQFFKDWLINKKSRVSPKTFKTYSDFVDLHIIPALGKKVLTKLLPQDVQAFLNEKSKTIFRIKTKEGFTERLISAKTVKHIHACLRCGLNDAMRFVLIHRNVAALVSPPKIVKKELSILATEQADKFLESIEGDRLAALYWTAIYLGLRRGELLGLRWQNIDFDSKIMRVSGALQEIEGKLVLTETKTETSRRSLPIPDLVLARLKTHRSKQLEKSSSTVHSGRRMG